MKITLNVTLLEHVLIFAAWVAGMVSVICFKNAEWSAVLFAYPAAKMAEKSFSYIEDHYL